MAKLLLKPLTIGYSGQEKPGVLAVELDGGSSRYRKDIMHSPWLVNVSWVCNEEKYDYLCAFYRRETQSGALPFLVDLTLDHSGAQEYEARIVPGTFRLAQVDGALVYKQEATLEVLKPYDAEQDSNDAATVAAYEAAHGEPS